MVNSRVTEYASWRRRRGVHELRRSEELPASPVRTSTARDASVGARSAVWSWRQLILALVDREQRSSCDLVEDYCCASGADQVAIRAPRDVFRRGTSSQSAIFRQHARRRAIKPFVGVPISPWRMPSTHLAAHTKREPSSRGSWFAVQRALAGDEPSLTVKHRPANRAYHSSDAPPAAALRPTSDGEP
jgi:hypothetical protein